MSKYRTNSGFYSTTAGHYDWPESEVVSNASALDEDDLKTLRLYYKRLLKNQALRPFYRYSWQRRIQPMVSLLKGLTHHSQPWRVLDVGCGMGTEAMLWVTLREGLNVTGVDLSPERINAAKARLERYEGHLKRKLPVQFVHQNIFDALHYRQPNVVWTMEAISHIDPAEKFISEVYETLSDPGWMVILDSHLLNPIIAWRILMLRRKGIRHTVKSGSEGEQIPYAEERLFSIRNLCRVLRSTGFNINQVQLSVFFPPKTAKFRQLFPYIIAADVILNRIPGVRLLGGIFTIVASKP